MKDCYFLCVALTPTQEATLMEVQRTCFTLYGNPSALALPPVLFLQGHEEREALQKGWYKGLKPLDSPSLVLNALDWGNGAIWCGPVPPLTVPDLEVSDAEDSQMTDFLKKARFPYPGRGWFYISIAEKTPDPLSFPHLLPIPVRVVRLQILRVSFPQPGQPWWKAVEWSIEQERWIKLSTSKRRE